MLKILHFACFSTGTGDGQTVEDSYYSEPETAERQSMREILQTEANEMDKAILAEQGLKLLENGDVPPPQYSSVLDHGMMMMMMMASSSSSSSPPMAAFRSFGGTSSTGGSSWYII